MSEISKFDWGDGTIVEVKKPNFVPPRCGERNNQYDPLQDCNVTNRIYELSLTYAKQDGRSLPSAEDTARAIKQVLPNRG